MVYEIIFKFGEFPQNYQLKTSPKFPAIWYLRGCDFPRKIHDTYGRPYIADQTACQLALRTGPLPSAALDVIW